MENSELNTASPPGGFAISAAGLALGLGCLATLPRPGIDLIFYENENICAREEGELEPSPPGEEEIVEPIYFANAGLIGGIAPGMLTLDGDDFMDSSDTSIVRRINTLVRTLTLPRSWSQEKVESPTPDCIEYTIVLLRRLFTNYGLVPYKITASKDGGVLAVYKEDAGVNVLRVEVDNDLDAVAVVSDGNSILSSGLLEQDDEESWILDSFLGVMA